MDLITGLTPLKDLFAPTDLTEGLESIQFQKLCPGGFQDILVSLRIRSNLLTTVHVAHACHFVALANRIKRELDKLKGTVEKQRGHRLMAEVRRIPGLKVGIIGVGRIGRQLASSLLRYGDVYTDELLLSSRQADLLTDFIQMGINYCKFNNAHVVQNADIVFICVAPHQLRYVIDDIRGRVKPNVIIYSIVLGFPALKLRALLQHSNIIKPTYRWDNDFTKENWPISDVDSVLSDESLVKKISLENENNDNIVKDTNLLPIIIYSLLNLLQIANLNRVESLHALAALIFNTQNERVNIEESMVYENQDDDQEKTQCLPMFDLTRGTPTTIRKSLDNNDTLRRLFSINFSSHFTEISKFKPLS